MLALQISAHAMHKKGTDARHCEDAFAYSILAGRAAVSDGASDAFEAGAWARLLAAMFVHAPPKTTPEAFLDWVRTPSRAWQASIQWESLPWYAEQKARDVGGLATFIGFSLDSDTVTTTPQPSVRWTALAVGDACLLHFHKGHVLSRFPVERKESFGNTPTLLSTNHQHNVALLEAGGLQTKEGTCSVGDLFILATDALAEWFYSMPELQSEKGDVADWETLSSLIEKDFVTVVNQLRAESIIRNDDVTMLVMRVVEEDPRSERR